MFNIFKKNPLRSKIASEGASIVGGKIAGAGDDINARIVKNMSAAVNQSNDAIQRMGQSFGDIDILNQQFMKSNQELMQQANDYLQRTQKMMK